MIRDADAVKAHVGGDGAIWFIDGTDAPALAAGAGPAEFADCVAAAGCAARVLGCPRNAELITALYEALPAGRLQIGSPAACRTRRDRANPLRALYAMRQWAAAASLGGWHPANEADLNAYTLISQIRRARRVDREALATLEAHPAWPYLRFVRDADPTWAAWLLSIVVDPRWFVDPRRPDRVSRLQEYLGLRPGVVRAVLGERVRGLPAVYCNTVLQTWAGGGPPDPAALGSPGNFLWRVYDSAGGGVKGTLRASQLLTVYLQHVWRSALYRDSDPSRDRSLFCPSTLFKTPEEVDAFGLHMAVEGIRV